MASQTKVESIDGAGTESLAERGGAGYASRPAASGAFAAEGSARINGADHPGLTDEAAQEGAEAEDGEAEDSDALGIGGEPMARDGSVGAGANADDVEDDEDVSLDELMISDSLEGDEEEEATDIHPGLSEAVLESSIRESVAAPGSAPDTFGDDTPGEAGFVEAVADAPVPEQAQVEVARALEETPPDPVLAAAGSDEEEERPDSSSAEAVSELAMRSSEEAASQELAPGEQAAAALNPPATPEDSPAVAASAALQEREDAVPAADRAAEGSDTEIDLDEVVETADPPSIRERHTAPETIQAKRRDAPLPSFDIPELEVVSATVRVVTAPADSRARVSSRPLPLPPLSEIAEDDDDDAVTHIGLPTVPETAANDYPSTSSGFQVADPAVAALQSLDAELSLLDPRRATTRVIPRIDPKLIQSRAPQSRLAQPALVNQLQDTLRGWWTRIVQFSEQSVTELGREGAPPPRYGLRWLAENVLPPLSLVLFGSGLTAAAIMWLLPERAPAEPQHAQAVQALQQAPEGHTASPASLSLAERARNGDGEALFKITAMAQSERTSALTLALEAGYQAQRLSEFKDFAKSVQVPAKGSLPPAQLARFVDFATSPETMLVAFRELTAWAGPAGPDVLYTIWERAAGGSRAASLAQQLLYSSDLRAKATPALVTALDLRSAATCDDYLRVLPAVIRSGDQRSSATLRALKHTDGCGPDGHQDCYSCLRDNPLLDDAIRSISARQ